MRKIIEAPVKSLFEQNGQQNKDTQIFNYLQQLPFLTFSDKGLHNIATRFGITVEHLQLKIKEFEGREGLKHG